MLIFPHEIVNEISSHLDQHDKLHLMLTCRWFYSGLLPRLFESVLLDASPRNLLYGNHNSTVIRRPYALKRFLQTLQENEDKCRLVKEIVASNVLPDVSPYTLQQQLSYLLPKLLNLKVLLLDHRFHHDLCFRKITLPPALEQLKGNFSFVTGSVSTLELLNDAKTLENTDLANFPELKVLIISSSARSYLPRAGDLGLLFFKGSSVRLEKLTIDGMTLSYRDAVILAEQSDFSALKSLTIKNCKHQPHDELYYSHTRPSPSKTFLSGLEGLCSLSLLTIELSDLNSPDSIYDFVESQQRLKSLSLLLLDGSDTSRLNAFVQDSCLEEMSVQYASNEKIYRQRF